MESEGILYVRSLTELEEVMRLMPRQAQCGDSCASAGELTCPECPDDEMCQFTVHDDCSTCPEAVCVPDTSASQQSSEENDSGAGPNVGAIAGGVIGGVVFVMILTYLAWRYLIRPKRAEEAMRHSTYTAAIDPSQGSEKDGASHLTRRSSTHTVHSIASTVLTRASNIIQIAYIPGVTNRSNPGANTAGVLVPPVPPIPMQHSASSSIKSENDDQHFFMPGDLRDSTYSGLSGYSDRASYATHTSYAPRSSIASTIYGKQAQVMTPAATGMRAKPTVVSVKSGVSGWSNNGAGHTPPVPSIDFDKFSSNGKPRPRSGASQFSVGSTFLKTATEARAQGAQVVKVGGGLKKVEIPAKNAGQMQPVCEGGEQPRPSPSVPTLTVNESPFVDPPEGEIPSPAPGSATDSTLVAVTESEVEDDQSSRSSDLRNRGPSPFGDEHATR